MRRAQIIIPCYNEAARLDPKHVALLVEQRELGVILVDDGSRDGTIDKLRALEASYPGAIIALPLEKNSGKGEAVRAGMQHAIKTGAAVVGYADADFSTPPDELLRLLAVLDAGGHHAVLGTRFARLGAQIERKRSRHYLGRVFATFAAVTLDLMVYDTQCGAKWFLVTPSLERALDERFGTRWAFDVELIGRLIGRFGKTGAVTAIDKLFEEPLRRWYDVGGSKLSVTAMVKAFLDLLWLMAKAHSGP